MAEQRYRLVSDNDGHDYVIPIEDAESFFAWLDEDSEEEDFDCSAYDEYRVEGELTFTDPRGRDGIPICQH